MRTKTVKYFTTYYTWQMMVYSLMYSGVNIMMYDLLFDGTLWGILITVIVQTTLLNGIACYLFFGIAGNKAMKWNIIIPVTLALCNILLIAAIWKYSLFAHIAAGFALAVVAGRSLRHSNGDNLYIAGKSDDVVEAANAHTLPGKSAYFPVDMGNKYKKLGVIDGVGKAVHGKYAGKVVAVMRYKNKAADKTYMCPLRQIKICNATDEMLRDFYSCEYELSK